MKKYKYIAHLIYRATWSSYQCLSEKDFYNSNIRQNYGNKQEEYFMFDTFKELVEHICCIKSNYERLKLKMCLKYRIYTDFSDLGDDILAFYFDVDR